MVKKMDLEDSEMFKGFRELRKDIKIYFSENLKSAEYYMMQRTRERALESETGAILSVANGSRFREYHSHKSKLSELCGLDAPKDKYDQRMFDKALKYLTERFLL